MHTVVCVVSVTVLSFARFLGQTAGRVATLPFPEGTPCIESVVICMLTRWRTEQTLACLVSGITPLQMLLSCCCYLAQLWFAQTAEPSQWRNTSFEVHSSASSKKGTISSSRIGNGYVHVCVTAVTECAITDAACTIGMLVQLFVVSRICVTLMRSAIAQACIARSFIDGLQLYTHGVLCITVQHAHLLYR